MMKTKIYCRSKIRYRVSIVAIYLPFQPCPQLQIGIFGILILILKNSTRITTKHHSRDTIMQVFFCKIADSKFSCFLFIYNTSLMIFLRPPKLVNSFRDKSRKKLAPPMRIGLSWVPPIFCWKCAYFGFSRQFVAGNNSQIFRKTHFLKSLIFDDISTCRYKQRVI